MEVCVSMSQIKDLSKLYYCLLTVHTFANLNLCNRTFCVEAQNALMKKKITKVLFFIFTVFCFDHFIEVSEETCKWKCFVTTLKTSIYCINDSLIFFPACWSKYINFFLLPIVMCYTFL